MSLLTAISNGKWECETFPEHVCTLPNEREPEVKDGTQRFLCLLENPRWPESARIHVLRPYTAPDLDDGVLLFGWTDASGNVYDHCTRSIHDDDERVVAWKPWRESA